MDECLCKEEKIRLNRRKFCDYTIRSDKCWLAVLYSTFDSYTEEIAKVLLECGIVPENSEKVLDYSQWRRFKEVIEKAKDSCETSGNIVMDHFANFGKMVPIGSGTEREVEDFMLTRYACYLIVMNGNPRKEVIALGQTYFAVFQNRRYQGLYGGLGAKEIHVKKGLKKSQQILDHMGSTELAANLFRATQTDEKIRREQIIGKKEAGEVHFQVGQKVRQTIKENILMPTPSFGYRIKKRQVQIH